MAANDRDCIAVGAYLREQEICWESKRFGPPATVGTNDEIETKIGKGRKQALIANHCRPGGKKLNKPS